MIKPEIEKLPKSVVDAIPLVIYIPPPPDEPTGGPITIPAAVHSYPPKPSVAVPPRRRFRFLRRKSAKTTKNADGSKADSSDEKQSANDKPRTWEDCWEQGEYPFVRLEGNRAACAICLLDFAEPKRVANPADASGNTQKEKTHAEEVTSPEGMVQEISVCDVIEEDRDEQLKLADAGEGSQPLRLLQCGHVFHVSSPFLVHTSTVTTDSAHIENVSRPVVARCTSCLSCYTTLRKLMASTDRFPGDAPFVNGPSLLKSLRKNDGGRDGSLWIC